MRRKLRDVTDQSIQTAALIFESLLHLSENGTTKRIASEVIYIELLSHRVCSCGVWKNISIYEGRSIRNWNELHEKELHNPYCLPNFIRYTKLN